MDDTRTIQMKELTKAALQIGDEMAEENLTDSYRQHLLHVRAALKSAVRGINILQGVTDA